MLKNISNLKKSVKSSDCRRSKPLLPWFLNLSNWSHSLLFLFVQLKQKSKLRRVNYSLTFHCTIFIILKDLYTGVIMREIVKINVFFKFSEKNYYIITCTLYTRLEFLNIVLVYFEISGFLKQWWRYGWSLISTLLPRFRNYETED